MRLLTGLMTALTILAPLGAKAEGLFSPAITVNERAVTNYEIDQRAKLLEAFRTPGDAAELARTQLVDDALRTILFDSRNIRMTDEALARNIEEFATRANLSPDEFIAQLASAGVDRATFEYYVRTNATWRDFIRANYQDKVSISDADVDAAIARAGGAGSHIQVLLSEIIIPMPPERQGQVMGIAENISRVTTTGAFEAAAREYSALQSKAQGGRLPWKDLTDYPAALHSLFLDLEPGQVTAPLPIPNGVALFQLRDVREVEGASAAPAQIDYATLSIAGGLTADAVAVAAGINAETDNCDDLYGVANRNPALALARQTVTPAEIPQDIALELAKMDAGESSAVLTRDGGQTLVYVMMCNRIPAEVEAVDRETITNQLRSRQLAAYADGLLAQLRDAATIIGE